jgi:hypothetical protein
MMICVVRRYIKHGMLLVLEHQFTASLWKSARRLNSRICPLCCCPATQLSKVLNKGLDVTAYQRKRAMESLFAALPQLAEILVDWQQHKEAEGLLRQVSCFIDSQCFRSSRRL